MPTKYHNGVREDSPCGPGGHSVNSTESKFNFPSGSGNSIAMVNHGY